ncbi:MAG: hypothetical protein V4642_01825 [Bacteroidota bacterium]
MKNIFLKAASLGAAFFCISFSNSHAQNLNDTVRTIYYIGGWKQANLAPLNERLVANGYPAFKENSFTSGIGFQENKNRWVTNLEVSASQMQEVRSAGKFLPLTDVQVNLNIGYEFLKTESFSLYPTLGIGAGVQYFSITVDRSFDQILINPVEQSVTLWNRNLLLNAALHGDYLIAAGDSPTGNLRFIDVGLQGGYTYAPWSSWTQNNGTVNVSNSPESNMSGAFLQLKLGLSYKPKN